MTRDEILALCEAEVPAPDAAERALAWQIEDRDTLEWAMGVLASAESEQAEIRKAADAARARIEAREHELVRKSERSVLFLRSAVEGYARQNRKALLTGKAKTASLIHGEIAYRSHGESVRVINDELAVEWARSQPVEADLIRTKLEINKRALNEWCAAHPEIPPGCEITPAREDILIRPAAPDTIETAPKRKEIK